MASKALLRAAQSIMDQYYQDFRPDDAFFDLEDFAIWIGQVYGDVVNKVAMEIYAGSRGETGMGQLIFSQDFWAKKTVPVKFKEATDSIIDISDLKYTGFTYDTQNSGIQQVGGTNFIRTTLTELWQLNRMSTTSLIYWWDDFGEIKLRGTCAIPKEVAVYYIPTPEDLEFKLPKSKEFEIATVAWNFMITAKKGTPFVDATNNSNKNPIPQTETDTKAQPAT